jgi:hypothetical protein
MPRDDTAQATPLPGLTEDQRRELEDLGATLPSWREATDAQRFAWAEKAWTMVRRWCPWAEPAQLRRGFDAVAEVARFVANIPVPHDLDGPPAALPLDLLEPTPGGVPAGVCVVPAPPTFTVVLWRPPERSAEGPPVERQRQAVRGTGRRRR